MFCFLICIFINLQFVLVFANQMNDQIAMLTRPENRASVKHTVKRNPRSGFSLSSITQNMLYIFIACSDNDTMKINYDSSYLCLVVYLRYKFYLI